MKHLIFLLSLKPILYGLAGMIVSGAAFPVTGVIIMHNNLIPIRYMLMHGVILGGMISIAAGLPLLCVVIPLNVVLVLLIMMLKSKGYKLSYASSAMMVCTMGIASLVGHISNIPAKDTLEVLWGSPFALTETDLIALALLSATTATYITIFFKPVSMIFFDEDIAHSLGVNTKAHSTAMLLFAALTVSVAMKVIGALLIDALLILPVISISGNCSSLKSLFIKSAVTGTVLSVAGYFISLLWNLPAGGVIAILACLMFMCSSLGTVLHKRKYTKGWNRR